MKNELNEEHFFHEVCWRLLEELKSKIDLGSVAKWNEWSIILIIDLICADTKSCFVSFVIIKQRKPHLKFHKLMNAYLPPSSHLYFWKTVCIPAWIFTLCFSRKSSRELQHGFHHVYRVSLMKIPCKRAVAEQMESFSRIPISSFSKLFHF